MISNQASPGPARPDRQFWLPDVPPRIRFVGIGAQKCASTWLHDVLAQHPEVCLPTEKKEIDFFSYHFDFGYQWYERHFAVSDSARVTGEISPSYLHVPGVPERVARYNPDMRVILIVRDPIARAYSNHKHEVRIGHLQGENLSFEAGLRNNPAYVEQGLYGRHLKRWLAVLSGEQVQIVRFEDVVYDPAAVLHAVCDFLRIGPMPAGVRLSEKSNESYLVRHYSFEAVKNMLRSTVRALGLGDAWQKLGDSGLRARYRRLNRVAPESSIGAPAPETIEILRNLFRPDVEEFAQLTGLSLDDWLRQ
jgi:hypothetical protein